MPPTAPGRFEIRRQILASYAEWTALSALRSGAPIKSRDEVYSAIRAIDFAPMLDVTSGSIKSAEFDAWHQETVEQLISSQPKLTVGWAAKIVNVYLKTMVYVGREGRPNLSSVIHPPIDGGLWLGLRKRFRDRQDILQLTNCVTRIKDIADYDCYRRIVDGCRMAAGALECDLMEVEQLWLGTAI